MEENEPYNRRKGYAHRDVAKPLEKLNRELSRGLAGALA
jgi:hypothetical protein